MVFNMNVSSKELKDKNLKGVETDFFVIFPINTIMIATLLLV